MQSVVTAATSGEFTPARRRRPTCRTSRRCGSWSSHPARATAGRGADGAAVHAARDLLSDRGASPRQHQNMLAFLAADRDAMEGLVQEARRFLAWRSVVRDHEALNLDAHQRREAAEGERASNDTVRMRLNETWRWLLVPVQHVSETGVSGLEWEVMQVGGGDSILGRASERMRSSEHLIREWSPALLKMELDRWFWRNRDYVPVKQVWDALCAYCYLPRLRDQSVFVASIQAGITGGDYFAYATSVSQRGRYEGLILGAPAAAIYVDATSVLVKPEAARAQLEAERAPAPAGETGADTSTTGTGAGAGGAVRPEDGAESDGGVVHPPLSCRFFGTARLDPDRAGRDMGTVAEEVLQHLTTLPEAKVEVTVEISATAPNGIGDPVRRIVDENCKTLRFLSHGFEDE